MRTNTLMVLAFLSFYFAGFFFGVAPYKEHTAYALALACGVMAIVWGGLYLSEGLRQLRIEWRGY